MRSSGQEHGRRHADQQRHRQCLPGSLGAALVVGEVVAVAQPQAQFVRAYVHAAVEGEIGHAGVWIFGQRDRRGEVGSGIAFVVGNQGQVRQASLLQVIRRGRRDGCRRDAGLRSIHGRGVGGGERPLRCGHKLAQPRRVGIQIGDGLQPGSADIPEQQRAIARLLGALGYGGQLEARIDRAIDREQFAGFGEPFHPGPHAAAPASPFQRGSRPVRIAASAQQPAPSSRIRL